MVSVVVAMVLSVFLGMGVGVAQPLWFNVLFSLLAVFFSVAGATNPEAVDSPRTFVLGLALMLSFQWVGFFLVRML